MKKYLLFLAFLIISTSIISQSIVQNVPFTNIGPTVMSGRVVDFDVNPNQPTEFYVAYASGGLWYTNNNGTSFSAVTENAPTQNMGDVAVDWKSGIIYIGTGESNSSRSSYAGIGILKSTDKGKTWINVGLPDSHHIGRMILNKNNPDELIVGAIGHLYTPNTERGIFKTTDGGKTWKNVLFINENTGVIDISVSPTNPDIMYAASWERIRKAWDFDGDGQNSAIYKSMDGGSTWAKLTDANSGFPSDDGVGRIGLAAFNDNIVYAFLDNQNRRPDEKKDKSEGLNKDDFETMTTSTFLELDNEKLNDFLKANGFPKKYEAKNVKEMVKNGKIKPADLKTYIVDANALLFDSPVIGAELYKSTDGGKTWTKTHDGYLDGVYSSYGYYFGTIGVNTANENKVYIGGVPLLKTDDGGKTFQSIGKENVHADHQALWINPKQEGHVINGNDGGVNITYDDGENWIKNNSPAVGQYYAVAVDNKKPYNVFGGFQDNGVWYGPSNYKASKSWESSGQYPYKRIGSGDGMQVQIDSRNNNIVYSGSQFGYYFRLNLETGERLSIHPKHELGDSPYRYNWQTPILLSPHNQDILYMGANKLLRSMNKGENFDVISDDLTTGGKKGNVPYGTLATISESPFQFGMIYTGSDDGLIYLTKDGGNTWAKISDNLPQDLWVSRVIASQHYKNRVYVTLNGYRNDDFKPYVYVSEDMGNTWKSIINGLPDYSVNVIKEDPSDENILYLGTDNEVFVSFDKGSSWKVFSNGIPKVAVHDLVIQEREKDLVIGTHGRSIYKANISPLQQYNNIKSKAIALFELPETRHSSRWGSSWSQFSEPYEPKIDVSYFVSNASDVTLEVLADDKNVLYSKTLKADNGYNYTDYDFTVSEKSLKSYFGKKKIELKKADNEKYYLPKGEYILRVSSGKESASKKLIIK
ncbi:glycosyl hydrolase [Aureibaculum sp. 2210JD6-5]|uniref:WD40/YVTN/BNR-like repeat-containing protein n=1 Tax=Aureibaculum sp. 2210JD6-5 TaxID=3103957 RepID=UPI002AACE77D|nr:glycosyl hydrolase [Aureibaculum sp. 2210JD6-5]MDY7394467.1 glycosyl hydrolase [Aureibaculum sp. 2210JD6-5]